jgi:tRNA-dihydrouridine synthase 2
MNTQPFRDLCVSTGADFVFTEEIIDRKLIWCRRVVNEDLGTIDFINTKENSVVLRTCAAEKPKLIL